MVKIGAVQMDVRLGDPAWNRDRLLHLAEHSEADLLVFPECANSGYAFDSKEEALLHAERVPGPLSEAFRELARAKGRSFVIGILEQDDSGQLRNTAVLVTPDGQIRKYWKTHLPYLGVDRYVSAGSQLPVFETPVGRIGTLICYDWRFPEAARRLALQGADVLAGPTNWPQGAEVTPQLLVPARAAENHVFVVVANRIGMEGTTRYIGQSAILHPTGQIIASLGTEAGTLLAEVDLASARDKRLVKRPGAYEIDLFADRRPDLYGELGTMGKR